MKERIVFILALAIVIPALFGHFWLVAVTGFLVETAVEPLVDRFLSSIEPD